MSNHQNSGGGAGDDYDAGSSLSSTSLMERRRRHRHNSKQQHNMPFTSEEEEDAGGETTPLISSAYNSDEYNTEQTSLFGGEDHAGEVLSLLSDDDDDDEREDATSTSSSASSSVMMMGSFTTTQLDPRGRKERIKGAALFCTTVSLMLLLLVVSFWRGGGGGIRGSLFTADQQGGGASNSIHPLRGDKDENMFFNYIVVGGGPSGIIVATKLARTFPHLRVLLLESGTESQMSVLNSDNNKKRNEKHADNVPSSSASAVFGMSGDAATDDEGEQQQQQSPYLASPSQLNKFDIPLLWSGLASSQDRRRRPNLPTRSTSRSQDKENSNNQQRNHHHHGAQAQVVQIPRLYSNHHWPLHNILLGRTLGGSGLHSGMIHVRALPSDLERWNMTHIWNFTSILPHYMALESYQHHQRRQEEEKEPCPATTNSSSSSCTRTTTSNSGRQQQQPWRGYHGPVQTQLWSGKSSSAMIDPIAPLFVQSALAAGYAKAFPGFNFYDAEPSSSNNNNTAADATNAADAADAARSTRSASSSRMGVGYYEFNIRTGVRDSIARAFLGSQSSPPLNNLVVHTGVAVTRVLKTISTVTTDATAATRGQDDHESSDSAAPDSKNDNMIRAFGVECVLQATGQKRRYLLSDPRSAAVILAAGAIMTPQILANSGIGDANHGVAGATTEMALHLPGVGRNLQDHPAVSIAFTLKPELACESSSMYTMGDELEEYLISVSELEALGQSLSNLTQDTQFALNERLGTLGTSGFSAGGFLRSPWADDESPDIQLTAFPHQIEPPMLHNENREEVSRLRPRVMVVTVALLRPDARYQVYPCLSVQHSEGSPASSVCRHGNTTPVMASPDQSNPLACILGYRLPAVGLPPNASSFLSKRDTERLAWGIAQVRKIQQVAPLAENTVDEVYPGANVTNDDLVDYVRKTRIFNSHWVGSTKMGPSSDPLAVVNERLSVHGMRGSLRIVDAGVLPLSPSGNTHSTVCAVASLGADLIAEDRHLLQHPP